MTTVVVVAAEADGPAGAKPANANPAIVRTMTPPTALRRARSKWRMPHIRSEGTNGLLRSPHEAHSKQDDARRREVFGRRERPGPNAGADSHIAGQRSAPGRTRT